LKNEIGHNIPRQNVFQWSLCVNDGPHCGAGKGIPSLFLTAPCIAQVQKSDKILWSLPDRKRGTPPSPR
jgi:hypothetical protein